MVGSSFITFIALAISVIIVSICFARRGRSMGRLQRIGLVGLGVYLPFVLGLTLGGIPIGERAIDPSEWRSWANLIPFATIGPLVTAGLHSGLRQLIGNLIILAPMGFGLPVVWQRFRAFAPTAAVGFSVALGIELCQLVISLLVGLPYRAFDVDDLILNSAGAMFGWVLWRVTLGVIQTTGECPSGEPSGRAN